MFWFYVPRHGDFINAAKKYGQFMKHVMIELDQRDAINRANACAVLKYLGEVPERRLKTLKVTFIGTNPYFYAGAEFIEALMVLFGPVKDHCRMLHQLTEIDLSGLTVAYDDKLLNMLSENHRHIEKFDIQNRVLVCRVTPACILRFVQRCRKLRDLRVFNYSLSEDVLLALTESDREPLEHFSVKCRRDEKYIKDIDDSAWSALSTHLPNLRVTLIFDHTCPFNKISDAMKPSIPVVELYLETFTYICDEVRQAAMLYKNTLEKLVLQTPMSRTSAELNASLIILARDCKQLKSLHIYCVLNEETVNKILELCPYLKEHKTYTLKTS